MYQAYQEWASRTYGDSAKTKTVTKKKYNRIVKILKGEESSNVENSKFRFWVKAKGFKLGPVEGGRNPKDVDGANSSEQVLHVPSYKVAGSSSASKASQTAGVKNISLAATATDYKRVAVVEDFYHIIYSVHVEMDGRSGKHAGQKRTYRAVAEMYAFLPREAVTRFLMSCSDCQKRMHLQATAVPADFTAPKSNRGIGRKSGQPAAGSIRLLNGNDRSKKQEYHSEIDFSLPITTTYLKRMKSLGYHDTSDLLNYEDRISNGSPPLFGSSTSPEEGDDEEEEEEEGEEEDGGEEREDESNEDEMTSPTGLEPSGGQALKSQIELGRKQMKEHALETHGSNGSDGNQSKQSYDSNREPQSSGKQGKPVNASEESIQRSDGVIGDEKRNSNLCGSLDLTVSQTIDKNQNGVGSRGVKRKESFSPERISRSELIIAGLEEDVDPDEDLDRDAGDEEDEDDEEGPGKGEMSVNFDIERLKAFNMFVRLFVDENLDRMVPISRQPKDKIQAIIDSCNRQFPEFTERARKRIRTYLKSCRRTRRHKSSPTKGNHQPISNPSASSECAPLPISSSSYHLSSPLAEQILATACDNEVQNAKRMRIGLKPIGVDASSDGDPEDLSLGSFTNSAMVMAESQGNDHPVQPQKPPPPLTGVSSGAAVQVLRPCLSAHTTSSSLLAALCQQKKLENEVKEPNQVSGINKVNGILSGLDANLRMKEEGSPSIYSLNPGEMAAVKQLISGYRESAAFLLRSADELENLLFQQPN